ncbi:MAG: MBOAT family O-acyltransferase [Bacteroidota bacterium]|nr:MBOAT family O-acyltransferase [Bacteroidota bacterium]
MEILKDIFLYNQDSPLLFTQLLFWVFFAVVLIVFSLIYKKKLIRTAFLFISSLFFYWKTGGYFFVLLLITTFVDFYVGKFIFLAKTKQKKKILLLISLVFNLSILAYFKYSYFIIGSINSVFHTDIQVVNLFAQWTNSLTNTHFDVSSIILPVGISFYTFQSLSYVIDISKGKLKPVDNIIDYGFFVTFFPQLVAGPIVRATHFIPQIYQKFKLTKDDFGHAIFLIMNGLIKKMIISDYISINFVDRVFDSPLSYSGFENLMATFGYGIQIYCDFSGYTDIAIGVALLLGFRIPINFNSPYKAKNISDFWKRWHISLTSWFRDYLFFPLALRFSKKLKKQKYAFIKADYIIYFYAALFTFIITGLWHGAAWRFVVWGAIHGIWIVSHRFWITHIRKKRRKSKINNFFSVAITFILLNFTWIFFRATDQQHISDMFYQIFMHFSWEVIPEMIISYKVVFVLIIGGYIIHWLPKNFKIIYENCFKATPVWAKAVIVAIVVITCYQAISSDVQPFIYFQF